MTDNKSVFDLSLLSTPWKGTLGLLLLVTTLGGFPAVETIRKRQIEKTEEAKKLGVEPRLVMDEGPLPLILLPVGYSYNFMIAAFPWALGLGWKYRLITAFLAFWPMIITPILLGEKSKKVFDLATHRIPFGVRGCVLAAGICGALYKTLEQPGSNELRFLSLACFAMAAWFSCGLGSVAGWASHPEYGDFAKPKRMMLLLVQAYFIVGFYLQIAAIVAEQRDDDKRTAGTAQA